MPYDDHVVLPHIVEQLAELRPSGIDAGAVLLEHAMAAEALPRKL